VSVHGTLAEDLSGCKGNFPQKHFCLAFGVSAWRGSDDGWPRADNKVGSPDSMGCAVSATGASRPSSANWLLSLPDDDAGPPAAVRSDGVR
jgi:hypothetical protein